MDLDLTPAQQAFLDTVERFARERVAPAAEAIDQSGLFPRDLVAEASRIGLLGMTVPDTYGGAGQDTVAYALAVEAVARASATLAAVLVVNNSLVAEAVARFGTDAQKETWLRALATGRALGAFALSEPQSGSDAAHQKAVARLDDRGYLLNGRKV